MTASDCPSHPFQAEVILPLRNREIEEVANPDPAVPVWALGQQLKGNASHETSTQLEIGQSMWVSESGLAACTRQAAALSCGAACRSAPSRTTLTQLNPLCPQNTEGKQALSQEWGVPPVLLGWWLGSAAQVPQETWCRVCLAGWCSALLPSPGICWHKGSQGGKVQNRRALSSPSACSGPFALMNNMSMQRRQGWISALLWCHELITY